MNRLLSGTTLTKRDYINVNMKTEELNILRTLMETSNETGN